MAIINVVIMELSEQVYASLVRKYSNLFSRLGYDTSFHHAPNERALMTILRKSLIHIAICDLSMGNTEDFLGLGIVQSVKLAYPEVLTIGNTRGDLFYQQTSHPTFDLFVNKRDLLNDVDEYYKDLLERLQILFSMNTDVTISDDSDLSKSRRFRDRTERSTRDLHSIVAQVTFTSHKDDASSSIRKVKLTPLSGGRSLSDVFRMEAYSIDGHRAIPAVLKISDREKAEIELANYNKFVKWILPYSWRVDVLGFGVTKQYGGICYSFALSDMKSFDTLTSFINNGDCSMICRTIGTIMNPYAKRWYGLVFKEEDITRRYYKRYFFKEKVVRSCARAFERILQERQIGIVYDNKIKISGEHFPTPHDALLSGSFGEFFSCICHGDLNSNNILLTIDGDLIFIDFQHTGRGHVFEDFIMLEISIRLNYPEEVETSFDKRMSAEALLSEEGVVTGMPWSECVRELRKLARRNFEGEPWRNYLIGLGTVAFSMMRYEMPGEIKERLIPCIVTALQQVIT